MVIELCDLGIEAVVRLEAVFINPNGTVSLEGISI